MSHILLSLIRTVGCFLIFIYLFVVPENSGADVKVTVAPKIYNQQSQ